MDRTYSPIFHRAKKGVTEEIVQRTPPLSRPTHIAQTAHTPKSPSDSPKTSPSSSPGSIHDDYRLGSKIGEGGTSVVHNCSLRCSQEQFAVKTISKKNFRVSVDRIQNEINVLKLCDHPNILKLEDVYEDENEFHLVMELITGGDLFSKIFEVPSSEEGKRLTEEEVRGIFTQLVEAVKHLHDKNVVHRDIKLENILLHGSQVKLSDFGFSRMIQEGDMMQTMCGTPQYVAPEMLMSDYYTASVDIWALGVTLYLMVFGRFPFASQGKETVYERILSAKFDFPQDIPVNDQLKDLISGLLKKKIEDRLTLQQVLSHPWIKAQSHSQPQPQLPPQSKPMPISKSLSKSLLQSIAQTQSQQHASRMQSQ